MVELAAQLQVLVQEVEVINSRQEIKVQDIVGAVEVLMTKAADMVRRVQHMEMREAGMEVKEDRHSLHNRLGMGTRKVRSVVEVEDMLRVILMDKHNREYHRDNGRVYLLDQDLEGFNEEFLVSFGVGGVGFEVWMAIGWFCLATKRYDYDSPKMYIQRQIH